jgi:hypothetical protein
VIELKRARIWQSASALNHNKSVIDRKAHYARALVQVYCALVMCACSHLQAVERRQCSTMQQCAQMQVICARSHKQRPNSKKSTNTEKKQPNTNLISFFFFLIISIQKHIKI